jgi:hypothetical protein
LVDGDGAGGSGADAVVAWLSVCLPPSKLGSGGRSRGSFEREVGLAERFAVPVPGHAAVTSPRYVKGGDVGLILAVLLIALILAILGFAVQKFLLILAVIILAMWVIGFFARGAEGTRWYRW